jgi:tRNA nucleotidyltransferase/poly(A) polymerase
MAVSAIDPQKQQRFALEVIERLRGAGFQAYWAGGCVRDRLMGRAPKDYDVATSARPPEVRTLFGPQRTLAVGAAFGVIVVRGPRGAGQIEVATFRRDEGYTDGRRPDRVSFVDAREDALRRDFTINGLFYDPVDGQVIDFVGGQADLAAREIRAIGDPHARFHEDRLRLLRAVRFAAAFEFHLEPNTLDAIRKMAGEIGSVSAERIADEMRRMLSNPRRARAVALLLETGLAAAVLPEMVPHDAVQPERLKTVLDALGRLGTAGFPVALATLVQGRVDAAGAEGIGKRWRLSRQETERIAWLVAHRDALAGAASRPWSSVQPLLVAEGIGDLLAMNEATAAAGAADCGVTQGDLTWCRAQLARPPEELNPPPLVTGDDLIRRSLPPGPPFKVLLERLRNAQLDGQIRNREEALALLDRLRTEGHEEPVSGSESS